MVMANIFYGRGKSKNLKSADASGYRCMVHRFRGQPSGAWLHGGWGDPQPKGLFDASARLLRISQGYGTRVEGKPQDMTV